MGSGETAYYSNLSFGMRLLTEMNDNESALPKILYFRSLVMPIITFTYLALQPSHILIQLAFLMLPNAIDFTGKLHIEDRRQPSLKGNPWLLESLLSFHFLFHILNLFLAGKMVSVFGLLSTESLVCFWLVIQASSLSGPIAGHALIHKKNVIQRLMGRLLLSTLFYEHFYTEHIRGHHRNVGLLKDYSTARRNETFISFLKRSVPGQFKHAWTLESTRLTNNSLFDRTMGNFVVQGVFFELAFMIVFFWAFGAPGLIFFVLQALVVHVLSQTFNYLLHWGLVREKGTKATDTSLSWDCNDQNIIFSMLAISRHAFHHKHPGKSYYEVQYIENSPKLPEKLVKLFWLILFNNNKFRDVMNHALNKYHERSKCIE